MQTPSDITLLQRWHENRDAHAFKTLTQRYGGLVHGICKRVLSNRADAEEITQECFLKLSQHHEKLERPMGPWLHSVAVRASLNRIRTEQRRRDREAEYYVARAKTIEYTANDLLEYVDEAINLLPDELRMCVIGHFLESRAQGDVAAELGVTTRTVRRRTNEAIEQVRKNLAQRGITTSAGALAVTLAALKAEALSPALAVSLGKIAMGGKAQTGIANTWAVAAKTMKIGGMEIMKTGIVATSILLLGLAAWWSLGRSTEKITDTDATTVGGGAITAPVMAFDVESPTIESNPQPETGPSVEENSTPPLPWNEAFPIRPITNPTDYVVVTGHVEELGRRVGPGLQVLLLASGITPRTDYIKCSMASP